MASDTSSNDASSPGHYRCTLTPELLRKAEEELQEKPEWRERDIQALRDMILSQPELHARTDDLFLLRFLRARKFDYDRALKLLLNYYAMRYENEDIFRDFLPSSVRHVLEDGIHCVLPNRDQHGRRVLIFKPGRWDPAKYSLDQVCKVNVMCLEKIIDEEETQVNGIVVVVDMEGISLLHARQISPVYAKKIINLIQECFPARIKGIHYVREPLVFGIIFAIIKPFLKEKTRQRIHFHGSNMESLHQYITPGILPSEFGGMQSETDPKPWVEVLLASEMDFEEYGQYGLGRRSSALIRHTDALDGLVNTYKKLCIE